jgi:UDP-glucose 4-epimerase
MRVLVTGSSGRIGSAIARRLSDVCETEGLDVRQGEWTTVTGDVADRALVQGLLGRFDAVVHTASLHAPHVGIVGAEEFRRVNVDGTRVLLDACFDHGVRRFVYTSTTSLYGSAMVPDRGAVWVTEDLVPRPRDIYDETKLEAEELCREASAHGMTCVSLRMSRCFPEPDDVVAAYRLHRGIDARDVAEAHLAALTAGIAGFAALNVSAATPFEREDCALLLEDATAVIRRRVPWAEAEFAKRGWALPRSIDRVYVIDKARAVLGWTPHHDFASLFVP